MVTEIKVPDIGSDKVEVTEILVKVGDKVEAEQSLITVEGDKASMEVPSPQAGVVKEIKISIGDEVKTGSLIMLFKVEDAINPTIVQPVLKEAMTAVKEVITSVKTVNLPDIGDREMEVTEFLVKVGDKVKPEQALMVIEGDKASIEVPAPFAGIVRELRVSTGDKVSTGSPIMIFDVENTAQSKDPRQEKEPVHTLVKTEIKNRFVENDAYVHATSVIRRLAREFGVNLAKIKGTGRKGRILREDVQNYVKDAMKCTEAPITTTSGGSILTFPLWPKVNFIQFGELEEVELGRIQKISGANLSRNWAMIPHVTHFDKTDITDLEAFRKKQNTEAENCKLDVKYTLLVFIMKAVSFSLEKMPRFNSSLSEDGQRLTLKKYINIGVAVDTTNGLVVPVFKDVNKRSITELSQELMATLKKARSGKLTTSDMQGGNFTISSLGGLGTTHFTPIVNAPEVAILGVSKAVIEPVWNGKEFLPRLMMPFSLSFDHRVIDGADGARFITLIGNLLSDIRRLVL
ncbi:pyruvate dehydrogenase complex dihydrolipoyllysine-residue acetyltransferase [Pantoea sp. Nvir]|uniref:pyruvate dehydrogenase complex dihydrolipoyllysine-residue acetyltransferase n=1 Tax=Pantoea sp. Nvir TaxID=2576760 RepID=UPI0027FE4ECF|nr:pyruvate dehydrogenase complex dihydrolipoyllysine-residue acetyltransferase [Pantoea sp. Nvir]CAJ0991309.1 Dihydrolipoyllysine-residue acetyltransferase component of pyruvate dehydrogenase complex [Pantoea sp. Nvir]